MPARWRLRPLTRGGTCDVNVVYRTSAVVVSTSGVCDFRDNTTDLAGEYAATTR